MTRPRADAAEPGHDTGAIAEFQACYDVSHETIDRLEAYVTLLKTWNQRINLVAQASLNDVWMRHIADSAQLLDLAPAAARSWVDLGSGAGLPGLVIAALAAEKRPSLAVRLVESDTRKAAFLGAAARAMGLDVAIEAERIEALPATPHDIVSARALAPLDRLCGLSRHFGGPGTVFLFPKGARLESELTDARPNWHIQAEQITSRTDPTATILKVLELEPRS